MCIIVSRRGMYFWNDQLRATKCEKDGRAYNERVPESEQGLDHLTEHEDMVVSRDGHSLLR